MVCKYYLWPSNFEARCHFFACASIVIYVQFLRHNGKKSRMETVTVP